MRYKSKAKELIIEHKKLPLTKIIQVLKDKGYRSRTTDSVQKILDDHKKKVQRKKFYERRKRWARNNPIRYRAMTLVSGAKQRANKKGIPFDINTDWVEDKLKKGRCQVTGLPFFIKPYSENGNLEKRNMFCPSLDQIIPGKGYTKNNVQVVVYNLNTLKSCGTLDEALITAIALVKAKRPELLMGAA